MAATLSHCQLGITGTSNLSGSGVSSSSASGKSRQSAAAGNDVPAVSLGVVRTGEKAQDVSSRSAQWATGLAAAAATLTVMASTTAVLACEMDTWSLTPTQAMPGDQSLSIAIPIPEEGAWIFADSGFAFPPPGSAKFHGGILITRNHSTGGCPSWKPVNFEMIVPDGIHPKTLPRQGSQWPAMYIEDDYSRAAYLEGIASSDPEVRFTTIIEALLRMSDDALTCFSL